MIGLNPLIHLINILANNPNKRQEKDELVNHHPVKENGCAENTQFSMMTLKQTDHPPIQRGITSLK
jgi:hypothetical protein